MGISTNIYKIKNEMEAFENLNSFTNTYSYSLNENDDDIFDFASDTFNDFPLFSTPPLFKEDSINFLSLKFPEELFGPTNSHKRTKVDDKQLEVCESPRSNSQEYTEATMSEPESQESLEEEDDDTSVMVKAIGHRKIQRWSEEEHNKLVEGVEKFRGSSKKWFRIAQYVKTKTEKQCKSHFQKFKDKNFREKGESVEEIKKTKKFLEKEIRNISANGLNENIPTNLNKDQVISISQALLKYLNKSMKDVSPKKIQAKLARKRSQISF
eukprot:TRINITY_DN839_c0_g1_i1.p1 TRINITY_DN839_c0_g1~~TRINITY_DN839_c0_g1_i1.p1  ORF type:complete len:268 (-),score=34.59 TRINITY_DN839_c0_g1_i1:58-861(-)